ncbi:MAG: valine--tRNA ligase [Proteobacteria bacterium]|nr:valine--tRNA ligase [Pseudomonadota bacterium]
MSESDTAESKAYDPKQVEGKWREYWLAKKIGKWDETASRAENFVIDTPPPTISGHLHMGHIYSYTQTDVIARFMRMAGKNVFYPMGWDDNGLPTERLVEKLRGIRAADMPREEFIRICHEVVNESEKDYRALFQGIGLSVDWDQEYQTIDENSRKLSQMSVLDLFQKGELYRQPQPTLWDVADQTALAQAEVAEKEMPGTMWQIPFMTDDGKEVVIATTRPELLGACAALMVSPKFSHLVGQKVTTPLYGVEVPVIADEKVDPEKGTGAVMCCTFGDVTDIEWWKTYKLPTRVIIDRLGRNTGMPEFGRDDWKSKNPAVSQETIEALRGLKVNAAKTKIVEVLRSKNLIRGEEAVQRMVPCAERSGAALEIIVTSQWLVRVLDKKDALIEQGRKIKWYPEYMRVRFEQWTENLKWDWVVSRQRYFGVPLPFWYSRRTGEEGKIIAADLSQLPVNPLVDSPKGYMREEVIPDTDVLDTWATSSITPQLSSRSITDKLYLDAKRHAKLYPAHLRPQAHEIIRTWAFYTILKSYLHEGTLPWETIALSGWCLAEDRTKMSKSKGTAIRPEDMLEENSADVIRYWTATSRLGLDTAFDRNIFKIGRKLQNKLWNAARFVNLQLQGVVPQFPTLATANAAVTAPLDRWISTRLTETIAAATEHFKSYDYADALRVTEEFFWKDFCDNYLELVKTRAYDETGSDSAGQASARTTLYFVLDAVLRLFAPVMPYLTEELYSILYADLWKKSGSIHARGQWPKTGDYISDPCSLIEGSNVVELLAAVRKAKSNANVSIKTESTRFVVIGINGLTVSAQRDLAAAAMTPLPEFSPVAVDEGLTTVAGEGKLIVQLALKQTEAA